LQAERLAAIGQTVAGLAHESRNAFQRSEACLELLAFELAHAPEQLELVDRIRRALGQLHHLYEEVRDYAAPITLDLQICDVAHVWRDAWLHLEVERSGKNVVLREEAAQVDLGCRVDWFSMGQVFRNILENALFACRDPGTIVIRCREVAWEKGRSGLQIAVRDNGPGIPEEIRHRSSSRSSLRRRKGPGSAWPSRAGCRSPWREHPLGRECRRRRIRHQPAPARGRPDMISCWK